MSSSTTHRVRRPLVAIAATTALALGLVACHGKSSTASGDGGSQSSSPAGGGAAKSSVTVDVKNFSFTPKDVTVAKGGKVTWKFEDSVDHNVDFSSGGKKSPDLKNGKSYSTTFNTPGTYSYICSIHQYMTGKVVVK